MASSPDLTFIHAADLHLDSPLTGLERYPGAPVEAIRGASRQALTRLVDLAVDEGVSLVLIAGDVYDGDWPDYNTGLFFAREMSRLREAGIPVVMISGNHDAQNRITKSLRLPDTVTVLSTAAPQSVELEELGVVVHGQGFATQAVTEDLAGAYPEAWPGRFNIGLLHTSLTGRPGHASYAPTSLEVLLARGYDYWALGHVHRREVVNEDPWVVFPGNLQGRHARETGPKGCTLVTVAEGRVVAVEPRELDVVRWQLLEVDLADAATPAAVVDRAAAAVVAELAGLGDQSLAVRLRLTGSCPAHDGLVLAPDHWVAELRARVADDSGGRAWLEKVVVDSRAPADRAALEAREDALGGLLRSITGLEMDEALVEEVGELFADLTAKIPAELRLGDDPLLLDDPEQLAAILDDVKDLLVARLLSGGDET